MMGNTMSFNNVPQIVETGGGLLDASAFRQYVHSYAPLSLTFDTDWVADAGDAHSDRTRRPRR
jgi:hypothetical protein